MSTGEFTWGTATAAYQVEGAWNEDGKGESNWDRWSHTPGKTKGGGTGDVACDHYHRWREDVALMQDLGVNGYRMSIAWSRVQPQGRGALNEQGMDFYDRLFDALLGAGIQPFVTLCHYDIPQALEDRGGWVNRDITGWFADYAHAMAGRFGDKVKHWLTINEPICIADGHYGGTVEPPGLGDPQAGIQAAHHLLLAHGLGTQAIKAVDDSLAVSLVNCYFPTEPATHVTGEGGSGDGFARMSAGGVQDGEESAREGDAKAAAVLLDACTNRWYTDPLYRGRYPEEAWDYREHLPTVCDGDMEVIGRRPDFLSVNYYTRIVVRGVRKDGRLHWRGVSAKERDLPETTMGWEVYPEGLYSLLVRLHDDYGDPDIYITENGMARDDVVADDGHVHDPERIDYLERHFEQALRARRAGVRLRGYFVWTLMDNFEWEEGWTQRFGLVYMDPATRERIPKDSALWYRDWIRAKSQS